MVYTQYTKNPRNDLETGDMRIFIILFVSMLELKILMVGVFIYSWWIFRINPKGKAIKTLPETF